MILVNDPQEAEHHPIWVIGKPAVNQRRNFNTKRDANRLRHQYHVASLVMLLQVVIAYQINICPYHCMKLDEAWIYHSHYAKRCSVFQNASNTPVSFVLMFILSIVIFCHIHSLNKCLSCRWYQVTCVCIKAYVWNLSKETHRSPRLHRCSKSLKHLAFLHQFGGTIPWNGSRLGSKMFRNVSKR